MKFALVCAILLCVPLATRELPAPASPRTNVQRLLKFSGTLASSERGGTAGKVTLRFAIYDAPYGGKASWQETQDVNLDAQGHYTALLGDTNPGGLPASVFSTGEAQWLEVQSPGKQNLPRLPWSNLHPL